MENKMDVYMYICFFFLLIFIIKIHFHEFDSSSILVSRISSKWPHADG